MDRLPPLTALRAFDAAARHMSFKDAAEELSVTPAALSFQIKSLEEHLGAPLFRRMNRAVELTEAGRALVPGLRDGFQLLATAWQGARRAAATEVLTVTAGPALTSLWLAPRMFKFSMAHPEIELRFSAALRIMDFDRDDIDVAIRFGTTIDDGLFSRDISQEWVTPMMSPALVEQVKSPDDLRKAVLLHQDDTRWMTTPIDWSAWFLASEMGKVPDGGLRFSQADHAINAAIGGAGVVMGRATLTAAALATGQLVAPFDLGIKSDAKYRVLCPEGAQDRPHIAAFLDWVTAEAADLVALEAGRRFVDAADIHSG
ncbi:MAG: transcriptional regulator GcvA [Pseudomonadota bacterium]